MTRKEIEKRCLEEMQQTIPDSEALWQRIEQQLPSQETPSKQTAPIQMTRMRRILAGAACFLLAAAGMQVFTKMQHVQHENAAESTDSVVQMEADEEAAMDDAAPEFEDVQTSEEILHYESLRIPDSESGDNLTAAGTQGEYFNEADVLKKTNCFVNVEISQVSQNADSGELLYTMDILGAYGNSDLREAQSITISSETAYMLENNHLYLLPVYYDGGEWHLAYECAPQIELTLDGAIVYHNGWQSLRALESEPLHYEKYGADDYFYDRMYLTKSKAAVETLLNEWEASQNA